MVKVSAVNCTKCGIRLTRHVAGNIVDFTHDGSYVCQSAPKLELLVSRPIVLAELGQLPERLAAKFRNVITLTNAA